MAFPAQPPQMLSVLPPNVLMGNNHHHGFPRRISSPEEGERAETDEDVQIIDAMPGEGGWRRGRDSRWRSRSRSRSRDRKRSRRSRSRSRDRSSRHRSRERGGDRREDREWRREREKKGLPNIKKGCLSGKQALYQVEEI
jgi:hypothetical protein